jgi:superfamily II DNA or RNA helicase
MTHVSQLIQSDPPLWTAGCSAYKYNANLHRKYRITSRFGDVYDLTYRDGNVIYLPRGLCPTANDDRRDHGEPIAVDCKIKPRSDEQSRVFSETVDFLKAGQSGIVEAYTGFGKTVLGLFAAAMVGRKTLIVTTKDDLFRYWKEEAQKFLGLSPSEVGEIRQDTCTVKGKKVVIAMIHSLSIDGRYPSEIVDGFGLVIFDECHRVPAEQFSRTAGMFPAKLRLGLSATPERADGKETLIHAHIGPVRVRTEAEMMVPKVLRFTSSWTCPRVPRRDPTTGRSELVKLPHSAGKTGGVLKRLIQDEARNQTLANLAFTGWKKGRKIVLFSDMLDHLDTMRQLLAAMELPLRQMSLYVGGMKEAELDRAKGKPVLLATYQMMSEGTNIPWLDLGIMGTPRSSVIQPCGRIRREYPDKPEPVWMDMLDTDSPVFRGYARRRLEWYRKIGATVKDM